MKTRIRQLAAAAGAVTALAFVGAVQAHHSLSLFEVSTPIWVKGTVVAYEPIAPHAMIYLEETTADGRTQLWRVEGPWPGRLKRILDLAGVPEAGDFFKAGDVIEICGFDVKAELKAQRQSPDSNEPSVKAAHGQMVVMPDGHMQSWGPYGQLDNCVRPNDSTESWSEFLNRDPLALDIWCTGRRLQSAPSLAPEEFLDEVSGRIDRPCE
jgi:hypothetical protein